MSSWCHARQDDPLNYILRRMRNLLNCIIVGFLLQYRSLHKFPPFLRTIAYDKFQTSAIRQFFWIVQSACEAVPDHQKPCPQKGTKDAPAVGSINGAFVTLGSLVLHFCHPNPQNRTLLPIIGFSQGPHKRVLGDQILLV